MFFIPFLPRHAGQHMAFQVPNQGSNWCSLQWKFGLLTTGLERIQCLLSLLSFGPLWLMVGTLIPLTTASRDLLAFELLKPSPFNHLQVCISEVFWAFTVLCKASAHTFSSSPTYPLCLLTNNLSPLSPSAPGDFYCTFCLHEFACFRYLSGVK